MEFALENHIFASLLFCRNLVGHHLVLYYLEINFAFLQRILILFPVYLINIRRLSYFAVFSSSMAFYFGCERDLQALDIIVDEYSLPDMVRMMYEPTRDEWGRPLATYLIMICEWLMRGPGVCVVWFV